ncbi:hypothetical protein EMIHUDRAFT_450105, partial [Emiliania huxleyi CCMP1516]|uniref:Uncharacterized protein n=2 Tax=Emiliania huxleyi TaxID=2903 RepID=A0A0D3JWF1_EMIH1
GAARPRGRGGGGADRIGERPLRRARRHVRRDRQADPAGVSPPVAQVPPGPQERLDLGLPAHRAGLPDPLGRGQAQHVRPGC